MSIDWSRLINLWRGLKWVVCFLIPILRPLTSFSIDNHKKALVKWFILVIAASAPVILTVLITPVPEGDSSLWQKMVIKLSESMTVSEQFVYTAAFLAPTLYLVWDAFRDLYESGNFATNKTPYEKIQNVMKVYRGYGWILLFSILILVLTAICFSNIKVGNLAFSKTFLYQILESYSWFIYAFSLYAFYLSIIQDYGPDGDFNENVKNDENTVKHGLSARVNKGNAQ